MAAASLSVLCLHGKQQNSDVFRTRLGRLPYKCRHSTLEFDIVEAPQDLPLRDGDSICYKTWFFKTDQLVDTTSSTPSHFASQSSTVCHLSKSLTMSESIEISLSFLEMKWKEKLNNSHEGCKDNSKISSRKSTGYDGVLGFSQGGTMAALLTNYPEKFPGLKFIICIGAPDLPDWIKGNQTIASFHLAGKTDQIVPKSSSQALAQKFNAVLLEHEQGHCIPTKAVDVNKILDFLTMQNQIKLSNLSSSLSSSVKQSDTLNVNHNNSNSDISSSTLATSAVPIMEICDSDDIAIQQNEEMEAISAIYPNDVTIDRPAPTCQSDPTGAFTINLITSITTSTYPDVIIPRQWENQLKLKFEFTKSYPSETPPNITLLTGNLSLMDFPRAMSSSLIELVRKEAKSQCELGGGCSTLSCIQIALDWLSTGVWMHCVNSNNHSQSVSHTSTYTTNQSMKEQVDNTTDQSTQDDITTPWYLENDDEDDSDDFLGKHNNTNNMKEKLEKQMIKDATLDATTYTYQLRHQQLQKVSSLFSSIENKIETLIQMNSNKNNFISSSIDSIPSHSDNNDNNLNEYDGPNIDGNDNNIYSSSENYCNDDDEEEEEETNNHSYANTIHTKRDNNNSNNSSACDEDSECGSGSGGVWHYTVGLIGKPSAGKSTFYNAVTRAALERDGRKLAQVAPHPFTTIDPNISPGWFLSPESIDMDKGRHVAHGRDHDTNRRLLPLIVKDVAGLVPGAYKGRGKGNRFLSDLCDADVLVHVVDATGRSDSNGNIIAIDDNNQISKNNQISISHVSTSINQKQSSISDELDNKSGLGNVTSLSTPSGDAQWIREELHRWIYNNVKAKWHSVCRKAGGHKQIQHTGNVGTHSHNHNNNTAVIDRVVAIFTGYKGSNSRQLILKAAKYAKLNINKAHYWSKCDVHKLVAHFLCVRFPVCLALNKVDLFIQPTSSIGKGEKSIDKDGLKMIQQCMIDSKNRGELAVPVSAACESFRLTMEAGKNNDQISDVASAIINSIHQQSRTDSKVLTTENMLIDSSNHVSKNTSWDDYHTVLNTFGSTGVMYAISCAVMLRPPILCYPVGDLDSEIPIAWSHSASSSSGHNDNQNSNHLVTITDMIPRLRDCILLKPGSTVGDVFNALKRGAIPSVVLQGEFVRAEGRPLCYNNVKNSSSSHRRQVGKDTVITSDICVLRIQTNRKSVFKTASV